MYRINYEFYDLHALLVCFRACPGQLVQYLPAIGRMITTFQPVDPPQMAEESVRQILRTCEIPADSLLNWALVDNRYTAHVRIIKDDARYAVLDGIFRELVVCAEDEARTVLLCDAVHNIPLWLADEERVKRRIKTVLSDYRRAYRREFLAAELHHMR